MNTFEYRKNLILARYEELVTRPNIAIEGNGVYNRYVNPVITAGMLPHTGNMILILRPIHISWNV